MHQQQPSPCSHKLFSFILTEILVDRKSTLKNFAKLSGRQLIEAVAQRCSVKKVFLEISLNSQENTCARVSF